MASEAPVCFIYHPKTVFPGFCLTSPWEWAPQLVIAFTALSVMTLSGAPNALRKLRFASAFHFLTGLFVLSASAVQELSTRGLMDM